MKKVFLLFFILLSAISGQAQLTYQHTYNVGGGELQVVDLLLSGRKYSLSSGNQMTLYNLDHSVWKTITYPILPGLYCPALGIPPYVSENLFKIDNKVDMVICYGDSVNMGTIAGSCHYVVFDEDGLIISNIDSCSWDFEVHNIGVDSFVAFVNKFGTTDVAVYSLPGTLPCNSCGSGPGLGISVNPGSENGVFLSAPVPNPSSTQARIEYKLKPGTTAEIRVFNASGKLLRTYKVDSTFDYLLLDNSDLPSGVYYYKIVTSGMQTSAKKMIIIK